MTNRTGHEAQVVCLHTKGHTMVCPFVVSDSCPVAEVFIARKKKPHLSALILSIFHV